MESGEERPVEGLGWDLLWRVGKGPDGDNGKDSAGRQHCRKGRQNPPACNQVQNLPIPLLLEPAGWMVEVMVRTED